jgi:hypothetical protein
MDCTGGTAGSVCHNRSRCIRDQVSWSHIASTWRLADLVLACSSTLNSLSEGTREVLRVLAPLPSSGIDIDLLSDLVQKPSQMVCNLLDEAATIGAVRIKTNRRVQFTHDKHHQAALGLITEQHKSTLYVTILQKLEDKGDDYIFARADLAMQIDSTCFSPSEKTRICKSLEYSLRLCTDQRIRRFSQVGCETRSQSCGLGTR